MSFWIKPKLINNQSEQVVIKLHGALGNLELLYNESTKSYVLKDDKDNAIECLMPVENNDYVIIGISQTKTERTLAVCQIDGEPVCSLGKFTSIGAISSFTVGLK